MVLASAAFAKVGDKVALDTLLLGKTGKRATVVIFMSVSCPVANTYVPRLNRLANKYKAKGVQFVGVNSNLQDSAADVANHAKEYAIKFAVVKDEAHRIADALTAQRTPEACVVDASGVIRYQGRIDDQYGVGYRKPKPIRHDLVAALDELLAGKKIVKAQTEVSGCIIGRETAPTTR